MPHFNSSNEEPASLTAEKLSLLNLAPRACTHDADPFETASLPGLPTGKSLNLPRPFDSSSQIISRSGGKHVSRSSRRSSRRSSSKFSSTRKGISAELVSEAESHFLKLIELTSNTSREASALRACWSRISSANESSFHERDEFLEQIDEIEDQLEYHEKEKERLTIEISEKKKRIETLLFELTSAQSSITLEKKRFTDREREVERLRIQVTEWEAKYTKINTEYRMFQSEFEALKLKLTGFKSERESIKEEHHRELHRIISEKTSVNERLTIINQKYEHEKGEWNLCKLRIRDLESERDEISEKYRRITEQNRLIISEKEEYSKEVNVTSKKIEDYRRRYTDLEESLRKTETTLSIVRLEAERHNEKIRIIEQERDEARFMISEVTELREHNLRLETKIRTMTESHTHVHEELERYKREHAEQTETMTTYYDSSREYEFQMESLRSLLAEAREQKELAIRLRQTADRERDEYVSKYEAKCRELERFEESAAARFQHHQLQHSASHVLSRVNSVVRRSESRASRSRAHSRNGTVVVGGNSEFRPIEPHIDY